MKRGDSIFPEFGDPVGMFDDIIKKTFSRRQDPATSKKAVNLRRIKGELAGILKAIDRLEIADFTARELAQAANLDYIVVQKRLSVLERRGYLARQFGVEREGAGVWQRTLKKGEYL